MREGPSQESKRLRSASALLGGFTRVMLPVKGVSEPAKKHPNSH